MTTSKFKTNKGRLTPYAFACGYIEQKETNNVRVTLWHEGGPYYHVRAHDYNVHARIFWLSFARLIDARKCFDNGANHAQN